MDNFFFPFIHWIQYLFPKRMATRFVDFDGLNGVKSSQQNFIDTSLHFYEMQDFQNIVRLEHIHPIIEKLQGCGLVELVDFLVVVQALELIYECMNRYNMDTRQIVFSNDTLLIFIDRQTMVNCLKILEWEDFLDLKIGGVVSKFFVKKMVQRKDIMQSWFLKPQSAKSKVPKNLSATNPILMQTTY